VDLEKCVLKFRDAFS